MLFCTRSSVMWYLCHAMMQCKDPIAIPWALVLGRTALYGWEDIPLQTLFWVKLSLLNLLGTRVFHGTSVKVSKVVIRRQVIRTLCLSKETLTFFVVSSCGSSFPVCVTIWLQNSELILLCLHFSHGLCVVSCLGFPMIYTCEGGLSWVINYRTQEWDQCCFPRKFQLFFLDCSWWDSRWWIP